MHLAIGSEDRGEADLAAVGGTDQPGRTRLERLAALEAHLRDLGVTVSTTVVPGAGHDADATGAPLARFLAEASRSS